MLPCAFTTLSNPPCLAISSNLHNHLKSIAEWSDQYLAWEDRRLTVAFFVVVLKLSTLCGLSSPSTKSVRHELTRSHLQNTYNHLDLSVNSDVSYSEHTCWILIIIRHGEYFPADIIG